MDAAVTYVDQASKRLQLLCFHRPEDICKTSKLQKHLCAEIFGDHAGEIGRCISLIDASLGVCQHLKAGVEH
eukprot:11393537-Alexandrium_andersonii.AAC.1